MKRLFNLGILVFFALIVGHNATAFEQRGSPHVKRTKSRDGMTLIIARPDEARFRTSMVPLQNSHSRLGVHPSSASASASAGTTTVAYRTRVQQSTIPIEYPQGGRVLRWPTPRSPQGVQQIPLPRSVPLPTSSAETSTIPRPVAVDVVPPSPTTTKTKGNVKTKTKTAGKISKLDVMLFTTYFCNMFVINLSVVTIPALAAASLTNPAASAAFESSVASMAPMGGAIGKIVNGFVCQRLGGHRASWMYLLGLAALSGGLSFTKSLGAVGFILMGYEFLSSIQWTSMCDVLDREHNGDFAKIARGISIMSLSSYCGALAAKTVGATLLNLTGNWRHVTRYGVIMAVIGATTMGRGIVPAPKKSVSTTSSTIKGGAGAETANPVAVLKSILSSRLFWMVGIGHSLGYIIRSSDRLLVPFLHEASGFPKHLCASMTSAVTAGFVLGLGRGTIFSKLDSINDKLAMLKRNYITAVSSFLGLALCALNVVTGWVKLPPAAMAGVISLLSGIAASSISFQFSQVPNLVASNVFKENKAVALSLVDAAGFFVTSQVLTANTRVLKTFGWSGSWAFLALFLSVGATLMTKNMGPILAKEQEARRMQEIQKQL